MYGRQTGWKSTGQSNLVNQDGITIYRHHHRHHPPGTKLSLVFLHHRSPSASLQLPASSSAPFAISRPDLDVCSSHPLVSLARNLSTTGIKDKWNYIIKSYS